MGKGGGKGRGKGGDEDNGAATVCVIGCMFFCIFGIAGATILGVLNDRRNFNINQCDRNYAQSECKVLAHDAWDITEGDDSGRRFLRGSTRGGGSSSSSSRSSTTYYYVISPVSFVFRQAQRTHTSARNVNIR